MLVIVKLLRLAEGTLGQSQCYWYYKYDVKVNVGDKAEIQQRPVSSRSGWG